MSYDPIEYIVLIPHRQVYGIALLGFYAEETAIGIVGIVGGSAGKAIVDGDQSAQTVIDVFDGYRCSVAGVLLFCYPTFAVVIIFYIYYYYTAKRGKRQGGAEGEMTNFAKILGFTSRFAIENPGVSENAHPGMRVRFDADSL